MDTNAARDATAGGVVLDFDIHDRLRKARAHYSTTISQDAFAELIGASGNTVGNYETGATTRLKDVYIRNWASVTGVDYWWLKTGQTPDAKKAPTPKGEGLDQSHLSESNRRPIHYKWNDSGLPQLTPRRRPTVDGPLAPVIPLRRAQ